MDITWHIRTGNFGTNFYLNGIPSSSYTDKIIHIIPYSYSFNSFDLAGLVLLDIYFCLLPR